MAPAGRSILATAPTGPARQIECVLNENPATRAWWTCNFSAPTGSNRPARAVPRVGRSLCIARAAEIRRHALWHAPFPPESAGRYQMRMQKIHRASDYTVLMRALRVRAISHASAVISLGARDRMPRQGRRSWCALSTVDNKGNDIPGMLLHLLGRLLFLWCEQGMLFRFLVGILGLGHGVYS